MSPELKPIPFDFLEQGLFLITCPIGETFLTLVCENDRMRFRAFRDFFIALSNLARSVAGAKQGIALVEMAIAAPFFALVIMGTVDTARFASAKLAIQQAVNRGLEMSMMGGPTLAATEIQSQAATQANVATSGVTVTQTLECSGTTTSWSSSCTTGQETARYTQVQISATFTPSFVLGTLVGVSRNSNGDIPISATGVIRIQ